MKPLMRVLAAFALCASPLLAGGLQQYKDWDDKPVAYFMTAEEHAAWKNVTTDEQAKTFVDQYLSKRGGSAFEDEANKRAAMADKYLTIGKLPASKTLRGKIIVLFGPPSKVELTNASVLETRGEGLPNSGPPMRSGAEDTGGRGSGGSGESIGSAMSLSDSKYQKIDPTVYELTYAGANMPKAAGRDSVKLNVVVEPNGRDRLMDPKMTDDLNKMFESIAQASIKNP